MVKEKSKYIVAILYNYFNPNYEFMTCKT